MATRRRHAADCDRSSAHFDCSHRWLTSSVHKHRRSHFAPQITPALGSEEANYRTVEPDSRERGGRRRRADLERRIRFEQFSGGQKSLLYEPCAIERSTVFRKVLRTERAFLAILKLLLTNSTHETDLKPQEEAWLSPNETGACSQNVQTGVYVWHTGETAGVGSKEGGGKRERRFERAADSRLGVPTGNTESEAESLKRSYMPFAECAVCAGPYASQEKAERRKNENIRTLAIRALCAKSWVCFGLPFCRNNPVHSVLAGRRCVIAHTV